MLSGTCTSMKEYIDIRHVHVSMLYIHVITQTSIFLCMCICRVYLERLQQPEEAVRVANDSKSIDGAKLVAK